MLINYKPLWKILIDREITRSELRVKTGISTRSLAKLGKNEDVSTEVLRKICSALDCELTDIIEAKRDEEQLKGGDNFGQA